MDANRTIKSTVEQPPPPAPGTPDDSTPLGRVLHLVDGFYIGGAERQAVQLACRLHQAGKYKVHVGCLDGGGSLRPRIEQFVTRIQEYPLTSFWDLNMLVQLKRFAGYLRENRIDIVQTHGFYTNIFGMIGASIARVPVRLAHRLEMAGLRTPLQTRVELATFRLASAIVANGQEVSRELVAQGVKAAKIRVVYNGLEAERACRPENFDRAAALEQLGLPATPAHRFVVIVANLRLPVKDYPTFLRAARRIADAIPDAAFVIAGEGELMGSVKELAAALGIAGRSFFIGHCEDIPLLLAASDVGVLSSKAEGFSNAILEYMAAALPVVATDVGGAREVVSNGQTGYLVSVGDDEALAARVVELLRNPGMSRAMGERGRTLVTERFSIASQVETTHRLYAELLPAVPMPRPGGKPNSPVSDEQDPRAHP